MSRNAAAGFIVVGLGHLRLDFPDRVEDVAARPVVAAVWEGWRLRSCAHAAILGRAKGPTRSARQFSVRNQEEERGPGGYVRVVSEAAPATYQARRM
jgi:hypothetical protein